MDIAHATRKVLFCGSMTAGGLDVDIDRDGPRLSIRTEGRNRKFVQQLEQVNFHGPGAVEKGQLVRFITERCVFRLERSGLVLTEIAPGIALDQVRAATDYDFAVADDLSVMSPDLFRDVAAAGQDRLVSAVS